LSIVIVLAGLNDPNTNAFQFSAMLRAADP
jgi:hypothetical protein